MKISSSSLLLLALSLFSPLSLADEVSHKCRLAHGSGPFSELEIFYTNDSGRAKVSKISGKWTQPAGRVTGEAWETTTYVETERLDDFTLDLWFGVDDWGAGSVRVAQDEYGKTSGMIFYRSDSSTVVGVYSCGEFPHELQESW